MIFGVNLGSSFIAPLLTRNAAPQTRIVPMGNLLMRGAGSIVILILYLAFKPSVAFLGSAPADQVINGHILFNIIILLAGVPLSALVLKVTKAIVALNVPVEQPKSLDHAELSALDESVLDTPSLALANATRETVRVCETVEIMLRGIIGLYENPVQERIDELSALDDKVDRKHAAIKLYLAKLTTKPLSDFEVARARELLGACVKLEQVGDIIVRNMLALVQKKMDRKLKFTDEGWLELSNFHAKVLTNARMAFNVLVSRDRETAHQLVLEKDHLRDLEKQSSERHFRRLREGTIRSVETSSIHLDTIRDLKQVNSLLAAMAYPVLEEQGLLNTTRLRALHS
jgi:phosphate:Na+ symporter